MSYKYTLRWTLQLLTMVQYAASEPCTLCDVASHHMAVFDDKKVADFPLGTYQGLYSLSECTHKCFYNDRCRSYQYNRESRTCSTSAVGYSQTDNTYVDVVDETGARIYTMCGRETVFGSGCSADSQCSYNNALCKNFRCACMPGYSFEIASGDCVMYCPHYGEFYDTYGNYSVIGCNLIGSFEDSLDACSQKCRDEESFVCANADFDTADGECLLCGTPWFDIDPAHREDPSMSGSAGWILTTRHCYI